jgi:rhamnopyranosyl-N-acetylglucosaminyl-diphospho-decaprenol beta-1,3/1,4-galactofuranosyltransferase
MSPPFVVAVVATHRRPRELAALLRSLKAGKTAPCGVVVVDNAGDAQTAAIIREYGECAHCITPGDNLGCGGGLRLAEEKAFVLFGGRLTHLWVLDDDAVVDPGALAILLDEMQREEADAAYPMVIGRDGRAGWTPGLVDREKRRFLEGNARPADYAAKWGDAPVPFTWAQGVALLVTRGAVEAAGFHRGDFWVRGEDLDFSLRLTARGRGIFVPRAVVEHLPPETTAPASRRAEFLKHCALLQNMFFLSLRQPHGRSLIASLPGALKHFLRSWSVGEALCEVPRAFWFGAVKGTPAGSPCGEYYLRKSREATACA